MQEIVDEVAEEVDGAILDEAGAAELIGNELHQEHDQRVDLLELFPSNMAAQFLEELGNYIPDIQPFIALPRNQVHVHLHDSTDFVQAISIQGLGGQLCEQRGYFEYAFTVSWLFGGMVEGGRGKER